MERFHKVELDPADYEGMVRAANIVRLIVKMVLMPVALPIACVISAYKWAWKTIGWN